MNNLLLVLSIVLCFSLLLVVKRVFGKEGIIAWMGVVSILAEIGVCKSVNVLGMSATLGNVLFASNFLATDILTECYGEKYAKKGVWVSIISILGFLLASQVMIAFEPNELDIAQQSMETLLGLVPRICISSVVMFAIANFADIKLYSYLKNKMGDKKMWLRNNICTIVCNGAENFIFTALVFGGTYTLPVILEIGAITTIIELVIALCDTPFLYIAKKIKG